MYDRQRSRPAAVRLFSRALEQFFVTNRRATLLKTLASTVLLSNMIAVSSLPGWTENSAWEVGIDRPHLQVEDAQAKEKTLKDIHTLGASWFRFNPMSGSPKSIANVVEVVRLAKAQHLNVLLNILPLDEDFDNNNEGAAATSGGWKQKKLSQINLELLGQRLRRLFDALKTQNLEIEAFEIGNEEDCGAYDADIPDGGANKSDPRGHEASPKEIKVALHGYGEFLKTAALIIRDPRYFPHAKLVVFGIAHAGVSHHLPHPAAYVAALRNVDGFNYLDNSSYHVDAYASHIYAWPNDVAGSAKKTLLEEDKAYLGVDKPIWLTEFGFLEPYKQFPNKKGQTLEQGTDEFLDLLGRLHSHMNLGPVFFYEYGWLVDGAGSFRPIATSLSKHAKAWRSKAMP